MRKNEGGRMSGFSLTVSLNWLGNFEQPGGMCSVLLGKATVVVLFPCPIRELRKVLA